MNNIYKEAIKSKIRFNFKGSLSLEDLFDLKVEDLDAIYGDLKKKEKDLETYSLLSKPTKERALVTIKLLLVRDIIEDKIKAEEEEAKAIKNKAEEQKILAVIAEKESENLKSMSIEQLTEMLKALQ